MTDRHTAYIVILEKDIREDDAQTTIAALKQIKGVADVKSVTSDLQSTIAHSRAKRELEQRLWRALHDD